MSSQTVLLKSLAFFLVEIFHSIHSVDAFCVPVKNISFCYFHVREAKHATTWADAWEICQRNGSSLPSIYSQEFQKIFISHLRNKNEISDIWLAGRQPNSSQWQWPTGKILRNQEWVQNGNQVHETQAVIRRKSSTHPLCQLNLCFEAWYPPHTCGYICQYPETASICKYFNRGGLIQLEGKCFVVYKISVTLYEAKNICYEGGGDLANFEDFEDYAQKYTSLRDRLDIGFPYWIGLRKKWWTWKNSDSTAEIKYSDWNSIHVNQNEECISIGSSSNDKWRRRSCTDLVQFLCQREEHTASSSPSSSDGDSASNDQSTSFPSSPNDSFTTTYIAVAIGVVALIVIATGILLVFKLRSRNSRSNVVTEERYDKRTPQQSDQHQRQYEHSNKKKGLSMIEGSDGNPVYAEITDNDITTTANQQTNNSDLYAQICSAPDNRNEQMTENNKATDEMTSQGVVYATMEFEKEK